MKRHRGDNNTTDSDPPHIEPRAISVSPILKRGDSLLSQICQEVSDFSTAQIIIQQLSETLSVVQSLYDFSRGSGMAAPQIGELFRISVVEFEGVRQVLINPKIVEQSNHIALIREGCLSFFDFRGLVPRQTKVTVEAFDQNGKLQRIEASGNFASLLQHEIDHLDGKLYVDRLPEGEKSLELIPGMPVIP